MIESKTCPHDSCYWTEKRANRKAADYFGKYYNVDWYNDTFIYRNKKHTYEEVYPAYMY